MEPTTPGPDGQPFFPMVPPCQDGQRMVKVQKGGPVPSVAGSDKARALDPRLSAKGLADRSAASVGSTGEGIQID